MCDAIQIFTLASSRDEADQIASRLVELRLAACVQVTGPVQSTYRWQGNLERSEEWLCLIKTVAERFAEVEQEIRALHSYDVPEIVAMPLVAGSADYLKWLRDEVSPGGESTA